MAGFSLTTGYQMAVKLAGLASSVLDQVAIEMTGLAPLPPSYLRSRVHGVPDLESFLRVGSCCASDILKVLEEQGVFRPGEEPDILDFGAGCGRTLLWMKRLARPARFHGTDIDAEAIDWCAENLGFADVRVNRAVPPLDYADGQFDAIYSISVFTHLNEELQFRWLDELRRVTKPGGWVLLTLHGRDRYQELGQPWTARIEHEGILVVPTKFWKGIFPEWYQNTYHTREYVYTQFGKYFEVSAYLPSGLNGHQDIVVLRKHP
jgi:SAM-dependent methyltransferase